MISKKSAIKSLAWSALAFTVTTGVSLFLTGSAAVALSIGVADRIAKLITFYIFDQVWDSTVDRKFAPQVVWLTGLSGSGKTTLGELLIKKLKANGQNCFLLDGDELRRIFPNTGFTKEERIEHIRRAGAVAELLEEQGLIVIMTIIGPYRSVRDEVKARCNTFTEVFVSAPLAICEARDPKGLYAKARSGEIKNFTGIDSPYEAPIAPNINARTHLHTPEENVEVIYDEIRAQR